MEATRRGIMGILGGAAAAGPALVKSVVAEAAEVTAAIDGSVGLSAALVNDGLKSVQDTRHSYNAGRLKHLKKMLRAEARVLGEEDHIKLDGACIKSMKSVSVVNQQRMFMERKNARYSAQTRLNLQREMLELIGIKTADETSRYDDIPF